MTESGKVRGVEFERGTDDFSFRRLSPEYCSCSVCHGLGAVIEIEYVKRDYANRNGKICGTLQKHERSLCICDACLDNAKQIMKKTLPNFELKRPTGRWMDAEEAVCWCSICGCRAEEVSNYCPDCGAAMRRAENERKKM